VSTTDYRRRRFRWRSHLPLVLLACSVISAGVAFAQFSVGRRVTEATVVLAMDASRSMQRTDVEPDRLTAAEDAARSFLERLPAGFDVGLVTFAGEPNEVVAPTARRPAVDEALASLPATSETGTVVGDGLSTALDAVEADRRASGTRPAAIVLLSDGLDTGSDVSPQQAAARARELGAPVFTVAIADVGGGVSTGEPGAGDATANVALLQQIAKATDGKTFTAATAGELNDVYSTLGSRLSYDLAISDFGAVFLVAATLLAIAAGVAAAIGSRRRF
jgi:Ca-activated chloride channel homolog